MHVLKCKICGGDMELIDDRSVGMCQHCGNTMTFPKIDDEQRAAAFNRGNHFRRIGEFDKALAVYERIVREDESDAEAHWCCALCRFGIEYVEDPASFEWLPTCHRASFDSFLEDVDYLAAVEHSEGLTRRQYQKDAAKIAEVQRGILATSQNAEPYDVFICYKESDENGRRTVDSTLAQDIYYQLTEQGRKVFFARITLEDVAGAQYEPYIFAALNSAKVMIVVGTKPEYLNAVWVRNEWSRFLAMMKKDHHKLLLPCYRDMDPYDLPEQLSVLQSYDMSKIGFIQDLIRGVAKVLDAEQKPVTVKETLVVNQAAPVTNIAPLLKRAFMFLEDGDWASANEYCEKVLDMDPECAMAYVGKLMVDLEIKTLDAFAELREYFDENVNYQKAMRFGDAQLQAKLAGYLKQIEINCLEDAYQEAHRMLQDAEDEYDFKKAAAEFIMIDGYKDSSDLIHQCLELAEQARLEQLEREYQANCSKMRSAQSIEAFKSVADELKALNDYKDAAALAEQCLESAETMRKDIILAEAKKEIASDTIRNLESATIHLQTISGWRNADELIAQCQKRLEEIHAEKIAAAAAARQQRVEERKKSIALAFVACILLVVVIVSIYLAQNMIIPDMKYNDAVAMMEAGRYEEAITAFQNMNGYKDSNVMVQECCYRQADALEQQGKKAEAAIAFYNVSKLSHSGYRDSKNRYLALWDQIAARNTISVNVNHAVVLRNDGSVVAAGWNGTGLCNVGDWTDIVAVCAGNYYTVGLKADGTVITAGDAPDPGLSDWRDIVAIAAWGNDIVGLKADGTVAPMSALSTDHKYKAIAVSDYHTLGLTLDGTVVVDRGYEDDQWDVSGWQDIVAISAGYDHAVGLKSDGTVVAVGENDDGQCNVSEWRNIVAVSAGNGCTMGLKADGTVVVAGINNNGQHNATAWTDIVAISTGLYPMGLKSDGTVIIVESFRYQGGLETWTDITKISETWGDTLGLKKDGTVMLDGISGDVKNAVSEWRDIVDADIGYGCIMGLKADGTVVAVGDNGDGQCNVSEWKDIVAVSTFLRHTVGLKANGTVVATGWNGAGECNVSGWKDIVAISVGAYHTVGLKADGTVVAVGDNGDGQCNVSEWKDIVAISVGAYHTVGLKADGTVVAVGSNGDGQCNVSGWKNIVAISVGGYHTVGLKADGTVVAVGENDYGQCNVSDLAGVVSLGDCNWNTIGLKADGTVVAVGEHANYGNGNCSSWTNIKLPTKK